jgi:hypothetical protein
MHSILNRFSKRSLLAVVAGLILSVMVVLMGFGGQLSPADAAPVSGVVIEETLAENQSPTPASPSNPRPRNGWTAWSG